VRLAPGNPKTGFVFTLRPETALPSQVTSDSAESLRHFPSAAG
jgi:hypothetical protein